MRRAPLLFVLFLLGCPKPLPPVPRPYPPPSADELLAAVQTRNDKLVSLRAEGKADHRGDGDRVKLTINVLVARGGRLRLEAENAFVGAVATLTTDGSEFQFLDTRHNRFLVGRADPCNVGRFVGVELSPEQVMTVLSGSAPIEGGSPSVSWDETHGGREVLSLRTPDGGSETLWLDGRNRVWDVLAAERKDAAGQVLWKVEHSDFQDVGGFRLPRRTSIDQPARKADVKIRWKEQEPNVPLKEGVFHLEPGLRPEPVSCQ